MLEYELRVAGADQASDQRLVYLDPSFPLRHQARNYRARSAQGRTNVSGSGPVRSPASSASIAVI
jgi:hypothetical protein